jgi:hypothetical protein
MMGRSKALSVLAIVSLSACSAEPITPTSPADAEHAQVSSGFTNAAHRPSMFTQTWEASDNDFTNPCLVDVPDVGQLVLPGVTLGRGVGTHMGRHTVRIHTETCVWDADVGGLKVSGPWEIQTANGDSLHGTYSYTWDLGSLSFSGSVLTDGGTGRFAGASGEAAMEGQDAPDLSGSARGIGWIVY